MTTGDVSNMTIHRCFLFSHFAFWRNPRDIAFPFCLHFVRALQVYAFRCMFDLFSLFLAIVLVFEILRVLAVFEDFKEKKVPSSGPVNIQKNEI